MSAEATLSQEQAHPAVLVQGVHKQYGRGKAKVTALNDLDMTVPTGIIYGLLGPSGCGKTTLLRSILGRLQIDQGNILTLGRRPGAVGHGVPGKMVGYMPQDLSLFLRLSIGETLRYFGRLFRMNKTAIEDRTHFLLQFLGLPEKSRVIDNLSGGQMRRTSFAVALLQEPELLILDEPTVGVDPLLRQRIWDHLLSIAASGNTTIIITTHYVEEARQAHIVGLMRNGRLLAESPPQQLMQYHNMETLEDVFLHLCQDDQVGDIEKDDVQSHRKGAARYRRTQTPKETTETSNETTPLLRKHVQDHYIKDTGPVSCRIRCWYFLPSFWNIVALVFKNVIVLSRQIGFLIFEFLLPTFQVILFCLCIGGEPYGLQMAVVNNETSSGIPFVPAASKMFLKEMNNHTIVQNPYSSMSEAMDTVRTGDTWGVISFGKNFTKDLELRYGSGSEVLSNTTIRGSSVHLHLDMTNQQIALTIQTEIMNTFEKFASKILRFLKHNPAQASLPIILEKPIYGDLKPKFTNFMAPGIIISITYFMATGLTALAFVMEKKQGLLDRSYVAGVSPFEVIIAHIITQLVVMSVQVGLMLVFALGVFQVPYRGPLVLVILLTLFVGFTGMSLGLVISAVCDEENKAIMMSLGTVYPNLLLSGIIWPLEAMPVWLRYISICMPLTYPAQAMRDLLSRGWDLTYLEVWRGFLVSIGWGWGMLALAGLILTIKRV